MDRFRVLTLRRLRQHRLRTAASVLGIAAGVALMVGMLSLLTSVNATTNATVELLGGARYEIPARALDDAMRTRLAAVPGVVGVGRVIEAPVLVDGTFAWLVALESPKGATFRADTARALASTTGVRRGAAFGAAHLQVTTPDSTTRSVTTTGRVAAPLRGFYGKRFLASDFGSAADILGATAGRFTSTLISGNPDPVALQESVGDARIEPVRARVVRARHSFEILFASFGIIASMALVVGAFLLYNTMNMAVLDRRHELASLRALGSDRRSIWRAVLSEAALLGAVGSLVGLGLGAVVARGVITSMPDAISRTVGTPLRLSTPAALLIPAFAVGLATSLLASISPARRALRIEPIEALRTLDQGDDEANSAGGIKPVPTFLALVTLGLVAFANDSLVPSPISLGLVIAGLLLLVFGFAGPVTRLVGRVAGRLGQAGQLARLSLERSPRRVWATTAAVFISIASASSVMGLANNLLSTMTHDLSVERASDFWVGTTAGDNFPLTNLPDEWREQIAAIPGVRAVAGTTLMLVPIGGRTINVMGVLGDSGSYFFRRGDSDGRLKVQAGKGVAVTRQYLRVFDKRLGDMVDLPGANPPIQLPIVEVPDGLAGAGGGLLSMSLDVMSRHYGVTSVSTYEVQLDPNADRSAVRRSLEKLAATASFPVAVYSSSEFIGAAAKSGDQMLSLIAMALLVIVICAGIAVLNTLLASVLERTGEIAVLRAIGATQRHLVRSVVAESVAIGLTGAVLGLIAGVFLHAILTTRISEMTSFHLVYQFVPGMAVVALGAGLGIALIGSAIPARRVARLDLLRALTE